MTLWVVALLSLIAGWILPLITVNKFFIFTNQVSIISALYTLFEQDLYLLLLIVFIASIGLPLLKLILIAWTAVTGKEHAYSMLHQLSKWSLADVFIVAFMVVTLKFRGLVEVMIEPGFYYFVLSSAISLALGIGLARHHSSKKVRHI